MEYRTRRDYVVEVDDASRDEEPQGDASAALQVSGVEVVVLSEYFRVALFVDSHRRIRHLHAQDSYRVHPHLGAVK